MREVNFTYARNNLKKVIDDVIDSSDYTVISRRDAPDAVLLSLDNFNSLMETAYLLKSPSNAAHLARSLGQLEALDDVRLIQLVKARMDEPSREISLEDL